nr:cupin domain-containing protein [Propionibacterium sp.]
PEPAPEPRTEPEPEPAPEPRTEPGLGPAPDPGSLFVRLFAANGWTGGWRGSVFAYHHYHSTAHEALGVVEGSATLLLGGDSGTVVDVAPGDVVVIPAGVAHRCLDDRGLVVVAGYDRGRKPDLLRGQPGERPDADGRIALVPLPGADPALGPGLGAGLWTHGQRLP